MRDPATGVIAAFDSLALAQRWWREMRPDDPPLDEAPKCAKCGGYFGPHATSIPFGGRSYHEAHAPTGGVRVRPEFEWPEPSPGNQT